MITPTDQQLLRDYLENRDESAFAELVRRHVDLVYSAALRRVRDTHQAQDVAQGTFSALAQNAKDLTHHPVLSGWLHRTTQNIAANLVRSNVRRQARELEAVTMNELLSAAPDVGWEAIAPHLDAALDDLETADRDAVMLRYFERKSAREMGDRLGISDDAAQKRVSRAVERLREFFSRRGIGIGATGLTAAISANAVQAAPVGLAVAISTAAALTGTTLVTTATAAAKAIAMTALQKTLIAATVTVLAGAGIYEARQVSQLREQNQTLQQKQAPLLARLEQLQREHDEMVNRLAALPANTPNESELLKLRGEVAQLKAVEDNPAVKAAKATAEKVVRLKQRLEQRPEWKIPELQFATEKDWAAAAWDADLDTDDGVREALSNLRGQAINMFLNEMTKRALAKYLAAHDDVLPADLEELKDYFDQPIPDGVLKRYQLLQSGKPDKHEDVIKLISYADLDYDSTHAISINGAWGGGFNHTQDAVNDAAMQFAVHNNFQTPTNPAQVLPYLSRPFEAAVIQKYLNRFASRPPSPEVFVMAPVLNAYFKDHKNSPSKGSDLLPYITTPEQKAAFDKLEASDAESAK